MAFLEDIDMPASVGDLLLLFVGVGVGVAIGIYVYVACLA